MHSVVYDMHSLAIQLPPSYGYTYHTHTLTHSLAIFLPLFSKEREREKENESERDTSEAQVCSEMRNPRVFESSSLESRVHMLHVHSGKLINDLVA